MISSLNLLRKYLRIVLEGKVEDLSKQNPNIPVTDLASSDSTPTKKLLPWMVKQVSKGADVEHVKSVASRFAKDGSRLQNKDINSYSEIDELESALDSLGSSKRSEKAEIKSGAVKIYEDDTCVVLRIDTKEAAQQYGKGTKWCITMEKERHYEEYKEYNILFYYVLRKEPLGDDLDKVAVAVQRDSNNVIEQIQVFNQTDKEISTTYLVASEDEREDERVITSIRSDAKSQPKSFLAKFNSDEEFSDDELIKYWSQLSTEPQKIVFMCKLYILDKEKLKKLFQNESDEEMKEILSDVISKRASVDRFEYAIRWNKNGKLHRENDKPAVIEADGTKYWLEDDKLHRENNQPAVIRANGEKEWWIDGEHIK